LIGQIDNVGGAVRYINLDALHAKRKTQTIHAVTLQPRPLKSSHWQEVHGLSYSGMLEYLIM